MQVFGDVISGATVANGALRLTLAQTKAENETQEVGTIIIPINQATNFVNVINHVLKEYATQVKDQKEKAKAAEELQ